MNDIVPYIRSLNANIEAGRCFVVAKCVQKELVTSCYSLCMRL